MPSVWSTRDRALASALHEMSRLVLEDRSYTPGEQMALLMRAQARAEQLRTPSVEWSAESVRQVFSHSAMALLLFLPDGQLIWANDAASSQLGYNLVEVHRGQDLFTVVAAHNAALVEVVARIFAGEAMVIHSVEYKSIETGRAHVFTVQSLPLYAPSGELSRVGLILVDETERSTLAARLDRSVQSLAHIIDAIGDPVLTCDASWRIRGCNRAGKSVLGPVGTLEGRALPECVARLGARLSREDLEEALLDGGEVPLSLRSHREPVPYGVRVWSMEEGQRVVAFHDRRLELERQHHLRVAKEQLERVNRELQTSNEAKIEFMNIVSHELRSPLVTIRGYVEMVLREALGPLEDAQRHGLGIALRNTIGLTDQIETLLDFSRIEQGRVQFSMEPVLLAPLILKEVDSFRELVLARHLDFEVDVAVDDSVEVMADRDKLRRILRVLLNNALKFTMEGEIAVEVHQLGASVEFCVRDTGVGIDEEHLPHIFDTFYQVQQESHERIRGTGLGLSVARDLVAGHGGELRVSSDAGGGSAFSFELKVVG